VQGAPPRRWTAGRLVALILGILLLLPALGLLAGGGVLLWADRSHRTDGFLTSGSESFTSSGYALTSERIHLATGPSWLPLSAALGKARLQVTGVDPGRAVFVGIAPVAAVDGYLSGVHHTLVKDIGSTVGPDAQVTIPGGAPSGPPTEQTFWTAQVSGTGRQQLTWTPAQGDWSLVVMNADGSPGVSIQARIGASAPGLTRLAWVLLGGGLLLTLVAVLLVVVGARRPRLPAAPAPAPVGPPAGGGPSWAPPGPRSTTETVTPEASRPGTVQPPGPTTST
jgi:hypothetical protein